MILPETIPRPDCYRTLPRPTSISHFGQLDGGTVTRTQRNPNVEKKTREATRAFKPTQSESGPQLNPTPSPLPANRFTAKLHQLSRKLHAENPNFPHPKFTKCGSNVGNPRKGDKRRNEEKEGIHLSDPGRWCECDGIRLVVVVLGKNRFNLRPKRDDASKAKRQNRVWLTKRGACFLRE